MNKAIDNIIEEILPILIPSFLESYRNVKVKFNIDNTIKKLSIYLDIFKLKNIPLAIVQLFFKQIFEFMDIYLFNSLITNPKYCSIGCCQYLKEKLNSIRHKWIVKNQFILPENFILWKYVNEAYLVLSIDKNLILEESFRSSVCSTLNINQITKLIESFQTDDILTEPVPPSVLEAMKKLTRNDINTLQEINIKISLDFDLIDVNKTERQLIEWTQCK